MVSLIFRGTNIMTSPNIKRLSLQEEGEEEGFCFDLDEYEDDSCDLRWCLVGKFLCNRPIHVRSIKIKVVDMWRQVKGVTIKQTKEGLFLFYYAHNLDMEATLKGEPWMFDSHLLILERVKLGVQIDNISLFNVEFWVQIHNLPDGMMAEKVGKAMAYFIGSFVEYDKNNNSNFWR